MLCTGCNQPYQRCEDYACFPDPHCGYCGAIEVIVPTQAQTEVISSVPNEAPTKKGCAMSISLSSLTDTIDEIESAIEDIDRKEQELSEARAELESLRDSIQDFISAAEEIDGTSVSVGIDSFGYEFSVEL